MEGGLPKGHFVAVTFLRSKAFSQWGFVTEGFCNIGGLLLGALFVYMIKLI